MVGGTIVDIVKVARDKWWVNCVEKFSQLNAQKPYANSPPRSPRRSRCGRRWPHFSRTADARTNSQDTLGSRVIGAIVRVDSRKL